MFAKINSLGLMGLNAFPVEVEIEASKGMQSFDIVGLADAAVRESRERIRSALRCSNINFPVMRVMVNLAPADRKKSGSVHDLGIAAALLSVLGFCREEQTRGAVFIGEVSLSGEIRGIRGVLPMTILARQSGFEEIYVPFENAREAAVIEGIKVYGVESVAQLVLHFSGKAVMLPAKAVPSAGTEVGGLDFADVKGQQSAKKALEIAAAGGHNVLMIGPPGSGKSMLAKRVPSILPGMTFNESIETTNIHSVAGLLDKDNPLVCRRPFRSPHHTVSAAGLSGGGSVPRPGEISLAHNGVLFLDELAEFSRPALEILRQPLEDRQVTISRVSGSVTYPCSFMLIAAMNPCPCGYYGHPSRKCVCSPRQVASYLSRVSGPLLDRFDIHAEVAPVEFSELSSPHKEEPSEKIRERVQRARDIQNARFKNTGITCNARITSELIREVCPMTGSAEETLKNVFERLGLSARAYDRILKVARTCADMEASQMIEKTHIAQAVQYRSLDRKYWGN
ncbi:YifB family Mg chelatase-like AAA ATPase [Ruminococcus sp. Marseille-P6503]|uniref:YifB family Mg chelatase-like AAA ATPase n=1 Tax=Ruminococcus sp. Marseille-P6503 TaxID=2364796 RepID=UPI000F524C02|nr:YifB family Mg chelatase-like AAA ATPase [Ruminococcus sp. Marseille-P6503]